MKMLNQDIVTEEEFKAFIDGDYRQFKESLRIQAEDLARLRFLILKRIIPATVLAFSIITVMLFIV